VNWIPLAQNTVQRRVLRTWWWSMPDKLSGQTAYYVVRDILRGFHLISPDFQQMTWRKLVLLEICWWHFDLKRWQHRSVSNYKVTLLSTNRNNNIPAGCTMLPTRKVITWWHPIGRSHGTSALLFPPFLLSHSFSFPCYFQVIFGWQPVLEYPNPPTVQSEISQSLQTTTGKLSWNRPRSHSTQNNVLDNLSTQLRNLGCGETNKVLGL
jgi:hypothetical protein